MQVRSRWMASPGTWTEKRTPSSPLRSWTRVKTWPFPSPTILSIPHTTHTSQVNTHTDKLSVSDTSLKCALSVRGSACTNPPFISLQMNRSVMHLERLLKLHKWNRSTLHFTGQSVKCAGAYRVLLPVLPIKRLSNQVVALSLISLVFMS